MIACKICLKEFKSKHACGAHQRVHSKTARSGEDYKALKLHNQKLYKERRILYDRSPTFCKHCNAKLSFRERKKTFCNSSCAATYNNTHKSHGTRKSKLEVYVEKRLIEDFNELNILFNSKKAIQSELDIYIPSLNLAFEINGIFHYKPIYSNEQFNRIQYNDSLKLKRCQENNIKLVVIDSSDLEYFKESNAEPYYNNIKNIVQRHLHLIK